MLDAARVPPGSSCRGVRGDDVAIDPAALDRALCVHHDDRARGTYLDEAETAGLGRGGHMGRPYATRRLFRIAAASPDPTRSNVAGSGTTGGAVDALTVAVAPLFVKSSGKNTGPDGSSIN